MTVFDTYDKYDCDTCGKEQTNIFRRKERKYPKTCRSCVGKLTSTNFKTYGERSNGSRSKIYSSWTGMRDRCLTKTNKNYKEGINLCFAWYEFTEFKKWAMENGFDSESQIRRKNLSIGYYPENCKVIKRKLNTYEFKGQMLTAAKIFDMHESAAVTKQAFRRRLKKGYSINKALMEPPKMNKTTYKQDERKGVRND